jgi:hypothetical protein
MLKMKSKKMINLIENKIEDIVNTEYFKFIGENYKNMNICNRTCRIFWTDMIKELPENWNDPRTWNEN